MDKIDQKIMRELQRNGRLSVQELAERVGLTPSPCLRRMRLLEKSGLIRGYTAIIDEALYGLPVTVFVRLRLERHAEDHVKRFEAAVRRIDEVLECHLLAGDYDYMLRVLVADLASYEDFVRRRIHTIAGIAAVETSFAYGTVKRTSVFPGSPT